MAWEWWLILGPLAYGIVAIPASIWLGRYLSKRGGE